jgi:hypothetical protein
LRRQEIRHGYLSLLTPPQTPRPTMPA